MIQVSCSNHYLEGKLRNAYRNLLFGYLMNVPSHDNVGMGSTSSLAQGQTSISIYGFILRLFLLLLLLLLLLLARSVQHVTRTGEGNNAILEI